MARARLAVHLLGTVVVIMKHVEVGKRKANTRSVLVLSLQPFPCEAGLCLSPTYKFAAQAPNLPSNVLFRISLTQP